MRPLSLLLLLAVPAFAEDKYDLRGPGPKKGQVVATTSKLTMKDSQMSLSSDGMKLKFTQTMVITNEEEEEYLEVSGRDVTKSKAKIVKDRTKTSMDGGDAEDKSGELEGVNVVSTKDKDGKWTHALAEGKADEEQAKQLKKRNGPENDDELYPAEKVAPGHKWTVDASKMKSFTGNTFTDVKGMMSQKFVKVETVDGEECAVVETSGTMTGKMNDDDGTPDVELKIVSTAWRSLKSGLEIKGSFKGTIKIEGKTKVSDVEVDIKLTGPIEGTSTGKLMK